MIKRFKIPRMARCKSGCWREKKKSKLSFTYAHNL